MTEKYITNRKAASGIRNAEMVREMINAGVDQFGISHSSVMKIILELAAIENHRNLSNITAMLRNCIHSISDTVAT